MILRKNKLYQNKYADLRDYEVLEAIKKKENVVVFNSGAKTTLTPNDLKSKKLVLNKSPFQSKVNLNQQYYLWSYLFRPDL